MRSNLPLPKVWFTIFLLSLFLSCQKGNNKDLSTLATLTTSISSNITSVSLTSGGNVSSDGGVAVTSRGVCWGTSQNPTTANSKTIDGSGTGSFTSSVTGLTPGATYYIRAYAVNIIGTNYGDQQTTSTLALVPTVTSSVLSSIAATSMSGGGEVTGDGGSAIIARGVCWGTSQNPTIVNSKTSDGTGTGIFTSSITGLLPATTYYVRAYATNNMGTSYGVQVTAATQGLLATVTTSVASITTSTTINCNGEVSNDGGSAVTDRGFCYSINQNPTIADSKTSVGSGKGTFNTTLNGLTPGTTYYIRAYATNSIGTSYGSQGSATTLSSSAIVTTKVISAITVSTASSGGEVTDDGGSAVTARGICWNTLGTPTILDSKASEGTGKGSFTCLLSGLTAMKMYYVRAYATNSNGTSYGPQLSFTTLADLPAIWPGIGNSLSTSSLSISYQVLNDGGSAVTAHGVCYGLAANPDILGSKTVAGTGTGSFTSILTGLKAITTYHLRIYATNSAGTAYSSDLLLTTWPNPPIVKTNAILSGTPYTASGGGEVTDNGGDNISQRGICYSTSPNPTIANSKTSDGTGNGTFTSSLTELLPNTLYFARAYATSWPSVTGYGDQVSFTTRTDIPALSTTPISNTTGTSATAGGNITNDGGSAITVRGVCWSISTNPTVANTRTFDGAGTGVFTSGITLLTPGTTYYVRAYATNTAGKTGYGNQVTIQTNGYPALTTTAITNISNDNANGGGNIFDDGGSAITLRGVCWSTKENPTFNDSRTEDGPGKGTFSSSVSSLLPGTKYYVRAYATNAVGTNYGLQVSFTTLNAAPDAVDADGNVYQAITIGTQTWMVGNLKTTKYRTGEAIANVTGNTWKNLITGAYRWYNDDISRKDLAGAMYNWYAVNDPRNVAPVGWHVATASDYQNLADYLAANGYNGFDLMNNVNFYWAVNGGKNTNKTKFNAYPAGMLTPDGGFGDSWSISDGGGDYTMWWTSGLDSKFPGNAYNWYLSVSGTFKQTSYPYNWGLSVRCVKD